VQGSRGVEEQIIQESRELLDYQSIARHHPSKPCGISLVLFTVPVRVVGWINFAVIKVLLCSPGLVLAAIPGASYIR
jgi:hypothetical protein